MHTSIYLSIANIPACKREEKSERASEREREREREKERERECMCVMMKNIRESDVAHCNKCKHRRNSQGRKLSIPDTQTRLINSLLTSVVTNDR